MVKLFTLKAKMSFKREIETAHIWKRRNKEIIKNKDQLTKHATLLLKAITESHYYEHTITSL